MAKLNWTQEQIGKYYEENVKLIHAAIKPYKSMPYEYDDLFQMASFGFMKAIQSYDDESGTKLSTYITKCVTNEVLYQTRKDRAKSRSGVIVLSYEGETVGKDGHAMEGYENLDLENDPMRPRQLSMEEKVERTEMAEAVKKVMRQNLSDLERKAITLFADDYTQTEIAEQLGLSQACVSKLIRQVRYRIILHLRRSGYQF